MTAPINILRGAWSIWQDDQKAWELGRIAIVGLPPHAHDAREETFCLVLKAPRVLPVETDMSQTYGVPRAADWARFVCDNGATYEVAQGRQTIRGDHINRVFGLSGSWDRSLDDYVAVYLKRRA